MPRVPIDYSNTIFYKIYCRDANVKALYVGHTTNFVQRKHCHKQACNNEKNSNYNLKVYKYIRDNGGWNNWKMEIIGFHECHDHYEARKIEQNYFESLNAILNSIEPLPKPKQKMHTEKHTYNCHVCNTICHTEKRFKIHEQTKKHKRNIKHTQENQHINSDAATTGTDNDKKISGKKSALFSCEKCNYQCGKQSEWNKHLATKKHNKLTQDQDQVQDQPSHICKCGKSYMYRQGLHLHKKKCNVVLNGITQDNIETLKLKFLQAMDELSNALFARD